MNHDSSITSIGTPGTPWGDAEVAAWRDGLSRKRSYATDVLQRIDAMRTRFDVIQFE